MSNIYRVLGFGITTDSDILDYIKKSPKLRPHFMGIFTNTRQLNRSLYKFRRGDFAIMNRDVHWSAIYRDPQDGRIKEYDSFGRDLWGAQFIDTYVKDKQQVLDSDCGQRTLEFLEQLL